MKGFSPWPGRVSTTNVMHCCCGTVKYSLPVPSTCQNGARSYYREFQGDIMPAFIKHLFKFESAVFVYNMKSCTYGECKQTTVYLLRAGIHTCRLGKDEKHLKLRG
jgi:hypothetical protein